MKYLKSDNYDEGIIGWKISDYAKRAKSNMNSPLLTKEKEAFL
jgi:hypothetical protein